MAVTTGERISAWQPQAYNIVGALEQAAHYAGELARKMSFIASATVL
jgi:hypothetical protein